MKTSRAQIVATVGPASKDRATLKEMITHHVDVVRYNFSWGNLEERAEEFILLRELAQESGQHIPIIVDLPGPRIQEDADNTYDPHAVSAITEEDERFIRFAVKENVDYIAVSFVGSPVDVERCREIIVESNGTQKIIAKIERKVALETLEAIITSADAVMVARGDLGNEIPLEQIPIVQKQIVETAKRLGKPVIVATGMLLSMTDNPEPSRAEVTDVNNAISQGADAVMLSEETARGKYPLEAVAMMEKIVLEAEAHMGNTAQVNLL